MKPSLLVIGLGNPGAQYEKTRHNLGFQAIDILADEFGVGEVSEKPKFMSQIQEARLIAVPFLLVKPNTYMNRSGEAVQKLLSYYKLDPAEQILIISDDVDIPLGDLRLKKKGGPGTHNGLKSIVQYLGEDFPRLRIGLGGCPADLDLANWVLSKLTPSENETLQPAMESLPEKLKEFVLGDTPAPPQKSAQAESDQD